MPASLTYEEVKSLIESKGGTLISEEYTGVRQELLIKTIDDVIETRKLVNIKNTPKLYSKEYQIKSLSSKTKHSTEYVRDWLLKYGVKLLSRYVNDITPLSIQFDTGEIDERTLMSMRNTVRKTGKLEPKSKVFTRRGKSARISIDKIRKEVESKGGELLSTTYEGWDIPLLVKTIDGEKEYKKIFEIRKWDELYSKKYRFKKRVKQQQLTHDTVKDIVESRGGKLLSEEHEYDGVHSPIKIETKDGQIETRLLSNIQKLNTIWGKSSDFEHEIHEYIKSLGVTTKQNDRTIIAPLEIDITISEAELGIECNGLFWHCDLYKDKNYHLNKTKLMNDVGYDLIHISESDWEFKRDIIKNLLAIRLGKIEEKIPARKCKVVILDNAEAKPFLEKAHLQGNSMQASYRIGLTIDDELVSVMTFSKPRFSKKYDYELCRFANKLNVVVQGAFQKLLTHFIKQVDFNTIVSYCDISYFSGKIYEQNGFTKSHHSAPNYKYFKPKERILESRNKYQKHKLSKILKNYDSDVSEYQNMLNNGFLRIWDCGNDVYVYHA